jgi:ABC-type multidrug transport system permease subunit
MGIKDLLKNPYADLVQTPLKTPLAKKAEKVEEKTKPVLQDPDRAPELSEIASTQTKLKFSPFIKLWTMILKDLRILLRSKSSSLVVIFGPLLVIFLVGIAFNTSSMYDLRIAAYSDSYSELSDSIINHLKDDQYSTFKTENLEDCIDGVNLGKFHACAVFSSGMSIGNKAQNIIEIHVDESRMNIAHMIELSIQKKVNAETAKISKGLTGNIVTTMFNTRDVLTEKQGVISKLSSSTSDSILKISGITDDLGKMDLAYNKSDINYTNVEKKADAIKSKINGTVACLAALPLDDPVFEDFDEAMNYLETGVDTVVKKFDSVINTRESSVQDLDSLKQILITGTDDLMVLKNTLTTLVAGIEGVEVTDVESIVSPVTTNVKSVAGKKTHLGYLFPTFIILIVMFMSLLFSTTVTMKEKLSKAFFRNFIMPTSDFLFMLGGYLTNIFIVAVQLTILFSVAVFFLPEIRSVLLPMLVVLFIVTTVFVLLGMFIGFVFKSEETATLGAISIGSLMLFFSNAILPIETLPVGIRDIAKYNPFVLSVNILKRIMLFGANFTDSFSSISLEVYMLFCFVIIFFVLAFVAREVTKSRMR